jgi:hypothetical protein
MADQKEARAPEKIFEYRFDKTGLRHYPTWRWKSHPAALSDNQGGFSEAVNASAKHLESKERCFLLPQTRISTQCLKTEKLIGEKKMCASRETGHRKIFSGEKHRKLSKKKPQALWADLFLIGPGCFTPVYSTCCPQASALLNQTKAKRIFCATPPRHRARRLSYRV